MKTAHERTSGQEQGLELVHEETELLRRALRAYFMSGGIDQPAMDSEVVEINGRVYVRLSNRHGILAVYRVRRDGTLRRLKKWPPADTGDSVRPRYIAKCTLKSRGWTEGLIRRFARDSDKEVPNPHYRRAAPPMKLYQLERIEQIEETPEFQSAFAEVRGRRVRRTGCSSSIRTSTGSGSVQKDTHDEVRG